MLSVSYLEAIIKNRGDENGNGCLKERPLFFQIEMADINPAANNHQNRIE